MMQNDKEKETKKLNAEELEKRVAPAALTFDSGSDTSEGGKGQKAPGKDGAIPK